MGVIVAIGVFVLVLLAGTAVLMVLRRRTPSEEKEARRQQRAREESLKLATRDHAKAVHQAEKALTSAEKTYAKSVTVAGKLLAQAATPKVLGSIAGVTLTEETIRTPQGTATLGPAVNAAVDTAGNLAVTKRVTLTRLVAGGVVGGLLFQKKEKTDTRELYLLVETPEFASIVQCPADRGPQVRQFAVAINNAARRVDSVRAARALAVGQARDRQDAVRNDRGPIELATAALSAARADDSAVRTAAAQLNLPAPSTEDRPG